MSHRTRINKRLKLAALIALALNTATLTGCEPLASSSGLDAESDYPDLEAEAPSCGTPQVSVSIGSKSDQTSGNQSGPAPKPSSTPPPPAWPEASPEPDQNPSGKPRPELIGGTCVSQDPERICLSVHFVSYQDSRGKAAAPEDATKSIVETMNRLWSACKIGFQVEKYESVDPASYGLAYGADSQSQLDQIRRTFRLPADQLLAVTTGPWGTAVNGWTNLPGSGLYGAIMEASIVRYGKGILYAHEFGHYLGLDHVHDESNVMNPVIFKTSTRVADEQCRIARNTVGSYWTAMLR